MQLYNGLDKEGFLADKRTQSAVVMSLVVIGEAATKVMDRYPEFVAQYPDVPICVECVIVLRMFILKSTLTWCGTRCGLPCLSC